MTMVADHDSQEQPKKPTSPPSSLGAMVDWNMVTYGDPSADQLRNIMLVNLSAWIVVHVSAYVIMEYILFPHVFAPGQPDESWDSSTADQTFQLHSTNSFFAADINHTEFSTFTAFLIWTIIVMSGIGLELFVWLHFLKDGWSPRFETIWKLGQFMFPLVVTASLGLALHQDFMALFAAVIGLWKFGFPETILSVYSGLYNRKRPMSNRVSDMLNGIGSLIHHSSVSLCIGLMVVGLPHRSWHPRYLLMSGFLAVMQHMLTPIHFSFPNLHLVLVVGLEAIFEWCLLSDLENVYNAHFLMLLVASSMIFAHWMYLVAGLLNIITPPSIADSSTGIKSIDSSTGLTTLRRIETLEMSCFEEFGAAMEDDEVTFSKISTLKAVSRGPVEMDELEPSDGEFSV